MGSIGVYFVGSCHLKLEIFDQYLEVVKKPKDEFITFLRQLTHSHFKDNIQQEILESPIVSLVLEAPYGNKAFLMKNRTVWKGPGTRQGSIHKLEDVEKFDKTLVRLANKKEEKRRAKALEVSVYALNSPVFDRVVSAGLEGDKTGDKKKLYRILKSLTSQDFDGYEEDVKKADYVALRWSNRFGEERVYVYKNESYLGLDGFVDEFGMCDRAISRNYMDMVRGKIKTEPYAESDRWCCLTYGALRATVYDEIAKSENKREAIFNIKIDDFPTEKRKELADKDFCFFQWPQILGDNFFVFKNNTDANVGGVKTGMLVGRKTLENLLRIIGEDVKKVKYRGGKEFPEPVEFKPVPIRYWIETIHLHPPELTNKNAKGEPSLFNCPEDVYRVHACKICGSTEGCMHERACTHDNAASIYGSRIATELGLQKGFAGLKYCPDCKQAVPARIKTIQKRRNLVAAIPEVKLGSHWNNLNFKYSALD